MREIGFGFWRDTVRHTLLVFRDIFGFRVTRLPNLRGKPHPRREQQVHEVARRRRGKRMKNLQGPTFLQLLEFSPGPLSRSIDGAPSTSRSIDDFREEDDETSALSQGTINLYLCHEDK